MRAKKMLTTIIIFITIISSISCATVNEVVEAYGAELGLLQRTAHPSPQAKIDFFSRFNQFLPIEKQLETLGDTSYEKLIDALIQIQQARIRLDAVYCEGDLCDLDRTPRKKMFKPGFDYNTKTFPTQAGDLTLPQALQRLQEAQKKILERKFPSCAVGQMRLFAQSNEEIWEPVKISYRVAHPALNPKMDFPAWPIACSEFVQAGNKIPNTFKPHRKMIRRLCGQKIDFESTEWEFEQTTVDTANKKAFAKCWIRTSTRRWFTDAIQNPELIENYPGILNTGCHAKGDYLCKQIQASQPQKATSSK